MRTLYLLIIFFIHFTIVKGQKNNFTSNEFKKAIVSNSAFSSISNDILFQSFYSGNFFSKKSDFNQLYSISGRGTRSKLGFSVSYLNNIKIDLGQEKFKLGLSSFHKTKTHSIHFGTHFGFARQLYMPKSTILNDSLGMVLNPSFGWKPYFGIDMLLITKSTYFGITAPALFKKYLVNEENYLTSTIHPLIRIQYGYSTQLGMNNLFETGISMDIINNSNAEGDIYINFNTKETYSICMTLKSFEAFSVDLGYTLDKVLTFSYGYQFSDVTHLDFINGKHQLGIYYNLSYKKLYKLTQKLRFS